MKQKIAGIVLAGGQGSRMKNLDKGLQAFQGKELIAQVIDRLAPQVGSITLSANRNTAAYRQFGYDVVSDMSTGFDGPMAGIAACLSHLLMSSTNEYALVCSCDTPYLTTDLAKRLHLELAAQTKPVAVAVVGEQRHNLHCLIRREAWPSLIDAYRDGVRAVYRWQKSAGNIEVDFSDQSASFRNINTIEDLTSRTKR